MDTSRRKILQALGTIPVLPIAFEYGWSKDDPADPDGVRAKENLEHIEAKVVGLDKSKIYLFLVDQSENMGTVQSLRIALAACGITGMIYPTNNTEKAMKIYELEKK